MPFACSSASIADGVRGREVVDQCLSRHVDRFGEVIADWAAAYADQTERDHAEPLAAIERGVLPVA